MLDLRMQKLARLLVNYSCKVQPQERVQIDAYDIPDDMTIALVRAVVEAGGLPFVENIHPRVRRVLTMDCSPEQLQIMQERDLEHMKKMQCYIAVRGGSNNTEGADVPEDRQKLFQEYMKSVLDQRVNHTKWVVLRWPSSSMAQLAGMSTEGFEDFFFDVCTLDYAKMAMAEQVLKDRMELADLVHIVGPKDTDLTFSIKGIAAIPCVGDRNIPDGECFTAPVRDSVNGVIHFNAGTIYNGKPFDDIRLVFKQGKIVEATGSDTLALNAVLDTDEGARYVGEFSLGFNPYIKRAMRDILFDEKIAGSFHFTPGQAYAEADNGNKSKIHWDMVMIQTPEFGGGQIWFDDELIRNDGLFVPEYLQVLNPDQLK